MFFYAILKSEEIEKNLQFDMYVIRKFSLIFDALIILKLWFIIMVLGTTTINLMVLVTLN